MKITKMNEVIHHLNPEKVAYVAALHFHIRNGRRISAKSAAITQTIVHGHGYLDCDFMFEYGELVAVEVEWNKPSMPSAVKDVLSAIDYEMRKQSK